MTTNKDFKRVVRGRMLETGESYTAARATLLQKTKPATSVRAAPARPAAGPDYAELAGWTDALIEAKTGCRWERWVGVLDYAKASAWPHREIARYLQEKFTLPGWWAQTITVGYERIKGLRAKGQRRDGAYEASRSRTYPVPLARLYRSFSDKRNRAKWLEGVDLTVRTATRDKTMRFTWPDGTIVVVGFMSKGAGRSAVQVVHGRLPDEAASDRAKTFWSERLSALAEVLA
jgi:hypothetical protein